MANSPISHPLSTLSDTEEPHDDSLIASLILPMEIPMPRTSHNDLLSTAQTGKAGPADHAGGFSEPVLAPEPMAVHVQQPKRRGRPKGSKNKPKNIPPPKPTIKTHVLEIQPGSDIVEMIHHFARTQNTGVSIVSGVGRVRDVVVQNPVPHEPTIVLDGTYEVGSIHGIFVGPAKAKGQDLEPSSPDGTSGGSYSNYNGAQTSYLVIELFGPRGQIWGGVVAGKLVAVSNVLLNVSTFANYEFHRLGQDDLDPTKRNPSTSNGGSSPGDHDLVGPNPQSGGLIDMNDDWDSALSMLVRKRGRYSKF